MIIIMKDLIKALIVLLIIYWFPFHNIWMSSHPKEKIEMLPHSHAVIVFGTLVRNGQVSPLLKERLDASIAIYSSHRAKQIVVSNQSKAALIMKQYLIQNGVGILLQG